MITHCYPIKHCFPDANYSLSSNKITLPIFMMNLKKIHLS